MANTKSSIHDQSFMLRIPKKLHKKIKAASIAERDSMNRLMNMILEAHFSDDGDLIGKILANTEKIIEILDNAEDN